MAYLLAGDKGGKVLIYNNFRYQKNKKTAAKIHWRCWRKECRTPLQSNLFAENEEDPNIQIIQVTIGINKQSHFEISLDLGLTL